MMNKRGAEDSFKGLVLGSIIALLFVFSIFYFLTSVGSEYGKDSDQLTNDYYDFSGINDSLENIQTQAETLRSTADGGDTGGIFSSIGSFFDGVGAFFGIGFSMFDFIVNLFDFIIVGTLNIIFANPVITGVVIAIVIIAGLFAIFRFFKQGS